MDQAFGEWKFASQVGKWSDAGQAVWPVDVCEARDYRLELTYRGEGRVANRDLTPLSRRESERP